MGTMDLIRSQTETEGREQARPDPPTVTRRDAIVALSAGGMAAVAGRQDVWEDDDARTGPEAAPDHGMETLRSLTTVLYPSAVDVRDDFLSTYLFGRIAHDGSYKEALRAGVETLDELAREHHGAPFRLLNTDQQMRVLRESAVRSGESNPAGTAVQRLNYHVVDELLFALYASPTGGELLGNANSAGFPLDSGYVPWGTQ